MTLRKILALSTVLAAAPFCAVWASGSQPMEAAALGGGLSPRSAVVVSAGHDERVLAGKVSPRANVSAVAEKEAFDEDDQDASTSEAKAYALRYYAGPLDKEDIYKALFGLSCNRSCFSYQSPFDGYLQELVFDRDKLLDSLKETVISVGLGRFMLMAGEEYIRRARLFPENSYLKPAKIKSAYTAEDMEKIVPNILLLQQTYGAVRKQIQINYGMGEGKGIVTMDDLINLDATDLHKIIDACDLIAERTYLSNLDELLNFKLEDDNKSDSETDEQSTMHKPEEKTEMLKAMKSGAGAFDKSMLSARAHKVAGDSGVTK